VRVTLAALLLVVLFSPSFALGQSPTGSITGIVLDPDTKAVPGAEIIVVNDLTGVQYLSSTNAEGIYSVPNLPPGPYRVQVSKIGFKTLIKPDIILNVQDAISINFTLPIGATSVVVTVEGGAPLIDTTDASVSTVVDRQFAENLPMNGRSFQTLIYLTPGVAITQSTNYDGGQFSVNGQRASSNYWMVDGVSANIGVSTYYPPGNGFGGALGGTSAQGGTNSLVSVDALQEFRIQTSTYAPEFGRAPGAQISIVTRSGTNDFHGTAFDYFRNDVLDANDWFADAAGLPKPEERQNDFGGTVGGPIRKDRTFFFFSYEGLRLRLPQTALDTVPDVAARQSATAAMLPYLNAFPLPNGPEQGEGIAEFNASYSNRSTLDAYSIRVDHKINDNLSLFGRYNYSPSENVLRGGQGNSLSQVSPSQINTQTATAGLTWMISSTMDNDLRFNFSKTEASSTDYTDDFGGAVPLTSLPLPSPFTSEDSRLFLGIFSLEGGQIDVGKNLTNRQQQYNLVDNLSVQKGTHALKFGVDYRRLSPNYGPFLYGQAAFFNDVPSAASGNLAFSYLQSNQATTILLREMSFYGQDTWRIHPRLTATYGLRWDVDFAPRSTSGPQFSAVTNYNLNDLSNLTLAPDGTAAFRTPYGNVAPRIGLAYQLSTKDDWQTVLRGGFGVFYDLASQEVGNLISEPGYPFQAAAINFGGTFPLSDSAAAPPAIVRPGGGSGTVLAFDPNLSLPYTLEWDAAVEQGLGNMQSFSVSYLGASGRRLLQTAQVLSPNANYSEAILVGNGASSNYNALQLQFRRRLSRGLEALASYTFSHSIDDASAGSLGNAANTAVPALAPNEDRGPSDFDIRHAFSAAATYDIPTPRAMAPVRILFGGWSVENIVQARSAPPVNVYDSAFVYLNEGYSEVRPDVVSGIPLYLYGSQYPGGKIINNTPNLGGPGCVGPFCPPPTDANGNPIRQGDLGRNALRGFGATQWDCAIHREFRFAESVKLQFRAELFNVLNHPNFAPPVGDINNPQFGQSTQLLGQALGGGNIGGGGFSPLYQLGGPRSIQLALKLFF
jgi:Carboxypeptidase regulatory-like domain